MRILRYSDELEISLYGLTQKEIIQTLLEERFSVKVHFDEIKTIYKERPVKKVNKIIQIEVPPNPYWATIGLTLEPLPLGTGLQIESDISYGYLNHSFQNAVFEGIRMSCQSGLHGWEVTDLKVTFTQAEYYSPVSTPADFRPLMSSGWPCNSQVWTFSNRCSILSCRYPKRQVPKLLQICKK